VLPFLLFAGEENEFYFDAVLIFCCNNFYYYSCCKLLAVWNVALLNFESANFLKM